MKTRLSRAARIRVASLVTAFVLALCAVLPQEASAAFFRDAAFPERISVILSVDGELRRIMAYEGDTVGDLLDARGVELGEYDAVLPGEDTVLSDGMSVAVTRAELVTETYTEVIPRTRNMIANEYIPKGEERVISEGKDGVRTVTCTVLRRGGQEIERTVVASSVTVAPVADTVEYGPGGTLTAPDGTTVEWSHKIDGEATAYTTERQSWKRTRSGTIARVGAIAVDPNTIPLGSVVYIEGQGWTYGLSSCEDTGGAIKGNIVDLFFNTWNECIQFGRRSCTIYVISTP